MDSPLEVIQVFFVMVSFTGTSLGATLGSLPGFFFASLKLVLGVAVHLLGVDALSVGNIGLVPFPSHIVLQYSCWFIVYPLL